MSNARFVGQGKKYKGGLPFYGERTVAQPGRKLSARIKDFGAMRSEGDEANDNSKNMRKYVKTQGGKTQQFTCPGSNK